MEDAKCDPQSSFHGQDGEKNLFGQLWDLYISGTVRKISPPLAPLNRCLNSDNNPNQALTRRSVHWNTSSSTSWLILTCRRECTRNWNVSSVRGESPSRTGMTSTISLRSFRKLPGSCPSCSCRRREGRLMTSHCRTE